MTVIRKLIIRSNIVAGAAVATAAATTIIHHSTILSSPSQAEQKKKAKTNKKQKKLEVYLMDRIAKKPYLNYHSVPNAIQAKRNYRGRRNEDNDSSIKSSSSITTPQNARPKGVPSRLRILALDVPQFKQEALEENGVCQLPSEIFSTVGPKFVDGIRSSKKYG